ncbi:uncharacterized protein LOC141856426 [Brevipalpus obovatus]|uniref:uncharacterized protein LOC141856426 n=1 Tax=Brevipalpus obovatus TaxID=246614 RepID=UPI003D9F66AC
MKVKFKMVRTKNRIFAFICLILASQSIVQVSGDSFFQNFGRKISQFFSSEGATSAVIQGARTNPDPNIGQIDDMEPMRDGFRARVEYFLQDVNKKADPKWTLTPNNMKRLRSDLESLLSERIPLPYEKLEELLLEVCKRLTAVNIEVKIGNCVPKPSASFFGAQTIDCCVHPKLPDNLVLGYGTESLRMITHQVTLYRRPA